MNRDEFVKTPYSAEAEASIIGALLLDNNGIHRIAGVAAEAFYAPQYADAFQAIQTLAAAGKPFDVITVYDELQQMGRPQELATLHAMQQYVPSAANMRRYADIVISKHRSRELLKAAGEISELALSTGEASAQIDAAQMLLAKLATVKTKREPQHISQSLADYLTLLDDLSQGKNPAISTGLRGLDSILNGGLRRGEMMVIGARPKHGKTATALQLARNMARDYSVLFISQEMPVMQLMHRHTAAMGTVDLGRILRADASDHGMWERVTEAAERLGRLNLIHDDQSAQSLLDIRRKAVQVKRQHGLDVLFVDFLQLMQGAGEDNRNRELDVIANGLKALALDLGIGVIVLSQMSRKADESYHHPTMTYLRDSGAIEAAADQIALLFTDHAHPMSQKADNFKGFSQLEIVAHRNGGTGIVPMHFEGKYQQISDWSADIPTRTVSRTSRGME
jgi:replicative DNA helicase